MGESGIVENQLAASVRHTPSLLPRIRPLNRRATSRPKKMSSCPQPAFLTGTSSEFLGKRHLPKILRERPTVFLLGPPGAGKTSVALRLAQPRPVYLERRALETLLVDHVRSRAWPESVLGDRGLVIDGPMWLQNRPSVVRVLGELLRIRSDQGYRTMVCQPDHDGSVNLLMDEVAPGSTVMLGLRYPKGRRGRVRFAARICDQLRIPRTAARGTESLEPWGYAQVIAYLEDWRRQNDLGDLP